MKILIAGDFVPRYRVAAQVEKGDYSCLDEVKPIIQAVDYAIVNFESPVVMRKAKPIEKTGPNLHCTEKAMECVSRAGFRCVTLANNHFRDFGQIGVEDTLQACRKYHVDFVGGGESLEEAQKILYKSIGGQTLAIINVCEHEWSIVTERYGGSNPLEIVAVSRAIRAAKQSADYVLVIVHGGTEQYNLPTPRMKETYRFFVEQGADAVVNHHQHCYSGYEIYHDKPVFYGLGNFCFDKPYAKNDKLWEEGLLVEIQFGQEISFELYPYVQCDESEPIVRMVKDKTSFEETLSRLNAIISDEAQLKEHYQNIVLKRMSLAKDILAPYSSNLFMKLYEKGLLPSQATDERMRKLLANVQCESHRDVLLSGLIKNLGQ